jgi:hypothetical protein
MFAHADESTEAASSRPKGDGKFALPTLLSDHPAHAPAELQEFMQI